MIYPVFLKSVSFLAQLLRFILYCFRIVHFKRYCQLLGSELLMVSPPKPLICIIENFVSLTKSHLFLVYFCHFRRKNDQLVSGGIILYWEFISQLFVSVYGISSWGWCFFKWSQQGIEENSNGRRRPLSTYCYY